MKLSREWLNEFTDIKADTKDYCDAMTLAGSKAEGWENVGAGISGVVVGRILEIVRHENSDHMWICTVDVGQKAALTVVTGAQNVRKGDLVPTAADRATLPGGAAVHAGKLRGVESQGLLCSLKELGLDTHDYPYAIEDGVFVLQEPCKPGDDIKEVLALNDTVVEFEITNNRADCLSVIGLARESAAVFDTALRLHKPVVRGGAGSLSDRLEIAIAEPSLCARYTAKMVRNIRVAPSPAWLRRRLRASGVRPINNIVDITNYVMLEYGQPMHAFDYACVKGGKIIVRRARSGEALKTLDDKARVLTPDMLVIADTRDPIGLAGVMGGGNSEITGRTEMIVFESANFNGTSIRRTAIALGMRTDASGRFEKGLDPMNTVPAVERACELVELLGAGEVLDGTIDAVAAEPKEVTLSLDPERINALLGTDLTRDFMAGVLGKLGFRLEGDTIHVPAFRSDIAHCADIAEEIARFYGYDRIAPTVFRGAATPGGYSPGQKFMRGISAACRGMGFFEVMTYSFGSPNAWDMIRLPADSPLRRAFVIQNPLGEDTSVMRTTALPAMLGVLGTNLAKRNMNVKLFEPATVYLPAEGQALADEQRVLVLGEYGKDADFFALKGCIEALLTGLRIKNVRFEAVSDNPSYHPGRCARISCGERPLGVMGQAHPSAAAEFGLNIPVFTAELSVSALMAGVSGEPSYVPLPRFPAITRDIAVVCDSAVTVAALTESLHEAGGDCLESCRLFDVYTGAGIPEGKRSVAFSLSMRARDQTLTDEHADEIVRLILAKLEKRHGAVIR
ncbi:MAG: phenylalanine--tRNA ligase subunit beta [Oscillospiraceae bacterium]|jgi:phenylalanyl-tRNA synthetase beta chain|nr:phenylalanine--tRNA ligase subunit beta [Oscillospiraceae bacterium]